MKDPVSRRDFVGAVSAGAAMLPAASAAPAPAALGGKPVRTEPFPAWPVADATEERALNEVVRSRKWGRGAGNKVQQFEGEYAKLTGSPHCLATANGTSALITTVGVLDVGPGDEVIVPPYTFVATVNAVLLRHALPVFVDSDLETFQIDAAKVEAAITPDTRAIIPVHLGGGAADVDTVMAAAGKRNIPVIEDACQSHLAEWKGRKVGTYGLAGCFSFQASKNLNAGEGGAILSPDSNFIEKCYAFHNNGRGRRTDGADFSYEGGGANLRLTEFQGALLMAQMTRLENQSKTREQNAQYLTSMLRDIPGIVPAKMTPGCTRNAYHLYMFRYQPQAFAGLPRDKFLKALKAEGIPASGGYSPLNREPVLRNAFASRAYQRVYGKKRLDQVMERNLACPQNDRLCTEAVWLTQNMLLGPRSDMDQIADAIRKVRANAEKLARS